MGLGEIETALKDKATWILRKLQEQRERRPQAAARIEWRDGASFPFLGEPLILVLDPRHRRGAQRRLQRAAGAPRLTLHVGLPQTAPTNRSATRCRAGCSARPGACSMSAAAHFAGALGCA